MSNTRRFYRLANFTLFGTALILPYFVLNMSFAVIREHPASYWKYLWIITPYLWFAIHGTLITAGNRGSWIVFSLLYIPASLWGYYYVSTSYPNLMLFSPAAVILAGLILFRIFNRIFNREKHAVSAARFDPPE